MCLPSRRIGTRSPRASPAADASAAAQRWSPAGGEVETVPGPGAAEPDTRAGTTRCPGGRRSRSGCAPTCPGAGRFGSHRSPLPADAAPMPLAGDRPDGVADAAWAGGARRRDAETHRSSRHGHGSSAKPLTTAAPRRRCGRCHHGSGDFPGMWRQHARRGHYRPRLRAARPERTGRAATRPARALGPTVVVSEGSDTRLNGRGPGPA